MKNLRLCGLLAIIALTSTYPSANDDLLLLPTDLQFIGAFRLPYYTSTTDEEITGESARFGYSSGRFAVSPATNSIFFSGSPYGSIIELEIPELVNTTVFSEMNKAKQLQPFALLEDRILYRTPANQIRSFSGMELIDGKLVVNAHDPYDAASAAGFDVDNFWIIENPFDLANTEIRGYSEMEGNTGLSGWLSPIPVNLQSELGGDYLTGSARMDSINARWSMGPSAASFNKADLLAVESGGTVNNTLLQFYLNSKRMWWQLPQPVNNWNYSGGHNFTDPNCPAWKLDFETPAQYNWKEECVLNNDMWTEVSRAYYGQIIPGTRTYLTLGRIGGTRSGIAYKIFPINGGPQPSSGEYPFDATDWDSMIWLFDVDDLVAHKNGLTESYDAQPYVYGTFDSPMGKGGIQGADYDEINNRLYISFNGDDEQGFESIPWVAVYEIALNRPKPPVLME